MMLECDACGAQVTALHDCGELGLLCGQCHDAALAALRARRDLPPPAVL